MWKRLQRRLLGLFFDLPDKRLRHVAPFPAFGGDLFGLDRHQTDKPRSLNVDVDADRLRDKPAIASFGAIEVIANAISHILFMNQPITAVKLTATANNRANLCTLFATKDGRQR